MTLTHSLLSERDDSQTHTDTHTHTHTHTHYSLTHKGTHVDTQPNSSGIRRWWGWLGCVEGLGFARGN